MATLERSCADRLPGALTGRLADLRAILDRGDPDEIVADGDVERITYHFADWFDHAERTLTGPDFDTAAEWLAALFDLDSLAEYVQRDR